MCRCIPFTCDLPFPQTDFRLVTTNAKIFNPPGTIYHIEADKIEAWGLDQISKSASTVIQYETNWNIEIEGDENIEIDDDNGDVGTPMDVDGRSPSIVSQAQPPTGPGAGTGHGKRGPRGPYKKSGTHTTNLNAKDMIDADGRLPGSKEGLGAFPPGSDWSNMMLKLKLKGV